MASFSGGGFNKYTLPTFGDSVYRSLLVLYLYSFTGNPSQPGIVSLVASNVCAIYARSSRSLHFFTSEGKLSRIYAAGIFDCPQTINGVMLTSRMSSFFFILC